jgi:hypothetical protein
LGLVAVRKNIEAGTYPLEKNIGEHAKQHDKSVGALWRVPGQDERRGGPSWVVGALRSLSRPFVSDALAWKILTVEVCGFCRWCCVINARHRAGA